MKRIVDSLSLSQETCKSLVVRTKTECTALALVGAAAMHRKLDTCPGQVTRPPIKMSCPGCKPDARKARMPPTDGLCPERGAAIGEVTRPHGRLPRNSSCVSMARIMARLKKCQIQRPISCLHLPSPHMHRVCHPMVGRKSDGARHPCIRQLVQSSWAGRVRSWVSNCGHAPLARPAQPRDIGYSFIRAFI
jgi:hypothetical protein